MNKLFKLKNGTLFLSTEAPGGIYNSQQLKKIADLCNKDLAIVKATEDQRIGLFVKEDEFNAIAKELSAVGLGFRNYQEGLHQPVSCIGELCPEHKQDALGAAMDLSRELTELNLESPLKIGINGCARCCIPCHTLDISIVGEANGYRISLGGKNSQVPEFASFMAEGVPDTQLPKLIKSVIQVYQNKAEGGESLLEVIDRCGVSEFVQALAPYSQDAAQLGDLLGQHEGEDLASIEESPQIEDISEDEFSEERSSHESLNESPEDLDLSDDDLTDFKEEASESSDEDPVGSHLNEKSELEDDLDNLTLDDLPSESIAELEDDAGEQSIVEESEFIPDDVVSLSEETADYDPLAEDITLSDDGDVLAEDELIQPIDDINDEDFAEVQMENGDQPTLLNSESTEGDPNLSPDLDQIEDEKELFSEEMEKEFEASFEDQNLDEELPVDSPMEQSKLSVEEDLPDMEDFPEEDLEEQADTLSEDDEIAFEQKLAESIEEESKLRAAEDKDVNQNQREQALELLSSADESLGGEELTEELSSEDGSISTLEELDEVGLEELDDSELQPLSTDDLELIDEDAVESAEKPTPINSPKRLKNDKQATRMSDYFKFAGVDFVDGDRLHLSFESGAFIDIDLSSLEIGEEKSFSLGGQIFVFARTKDGFLLEVQGVRLFYPVTSLKQVS